MRKHIVMIMVLVAIECNGNLGAMQKNVSDRTETVRTLLGYGALIGPAKDAMHYNELHGMITMVNNYDAADTPHKTNTLLSMYKKSNLNPTSNIDADNFTLLINRSVALNYDLALKGFWLLFEDHNGKAFDPVFLLEKAMVKNICELYFTRFQEFKLTLSGN